MFLSWSVKAVKTARHVRNNTTIYFFQSFSSIHCILKTYTRFNDFVYFKFQYILERKNLRSYKQPKITVEKGKKREKGEYKWINGVLTVTISVPFAVHVRNCQIQSTCIIWLTPLYGEIPNHRQQASPALFQEQHDYLIKGTSLANAL